jgi:hypothetical protein
MAFTFVSKSDITFLISKIKTALGGKVDKVTGKGLSTNDLTDSLKTSYDGGLTDIANLKKVGAQANVIEGITLNGTKITPDSSKNVSLSTPTTESIKTQIESYGYQTASDVDSIVSAKGYQTASQVNSAISSAVGKITGLSTEVVTSLPTTGKAGTIYFVAHNHSDSGDSYDEYIWITSSKAYEKIGHTDVDLSGYAKISDFSEIGTTELDTLWKA